MISFPRSTSFRLSVGLLFLFTLFLINLQSYSNYKYDNGSQQAFNDNDDDETFPATSSSSSSSKSNNNNNNNKVNNNSKNNQLSQQWSTDRDEKDRTRVARPTFQVPDDLYLTHDVAIPQDIPPWTLNDTLLLDTTMGHHIMSEILRPQYSLYEPISENIKLDFADLSRTERIYKSLWNHVLPIFDRLPGRNDRAREQAYIRMLADMQPTSIPISNTDLKGDDEKDRSPTFSSEDEEAASTRVAGGNKDNNIPQGWHPELDLFSRLEKKLFPWIHHNRQSAFSLYHSFKGQGIVYCAGNGQFEFVVTAIMAVRHRLQSKLPIQVFHMGDGDLSRERQDYLRNMAEGIEVLDVTQVFDNEILRLGGWAIKPFAMLASSFEEVMFIDADAYFLQDPAVLFDDPGYKATGALFFYDRTLFPNWQTGSEWMKSIMPQMSSFVPMSRWFRQTSSHEQESGVVLINKKTRFLGLLSTCKMNSYYERELVTYKVFHGDKETFWTGFEMIQEPYVFMRNYGGVIGELRPDDDQSVCGAQLHQDYLKKPLWWNGGLYRNKNSGVNRYLDFGYWMEGGGQQKHREYFTQDKEQMEHILALLGVDKVEDLKMEPKDAEWDFGESCLKGAKVNALKASDKTLTNGFVDLDKIARIDGQKFYQGENVDPKESWKNIEKIGGRSDEENETTE